MKTDKELKELLASVLGTFPFLPKDKPTLGENEDFIAVWQFDGKYFEIFPNRNGDLEIMIASNDGWKNWILKQVDLG